MTRTRSGPVIDRPTTSPHTPSSLAAPGEHGAAYAYAAPPCPGRRLTAVMVLRCGLCGAGHTHRTADLAGLLAGTVVRVCPTTRRAYLLAPVRRLDDVVRRDTFVPRQRLDGSGGAE